MLCVPMSPYGLLFFYCCLSIISVYATALASLHGLHYRSTTRTDVQEQRTTCRLKREDIPPTNTPPGIRVTNAVFHVFSSYYRYFYSGPLPSGSRKDRYFNLLLGAHLKDKVIVLTFPLHTVSLG